MQLVTADINNYRSIEHVTISNIGGFNVFIGKNNFGKSNIFVAIEEFFRATRSEFIIAMNPKIGEKIDFHNQNVSNELVIRCGFKLTESELREIISSISAEQPQISAVAQLLSGYRTLNITVKFYPAPLRCSAIYLIELENSDTKDKKILLSLDNNSVRELQKLEEERAFVTATLEALQSIMEQIGTISSEVIELQARSRSEPERGVRPTRSLRDRLRMLLRRDVPEAPPQLISSLDDIFTNSKTREEIEAQVRDELESAKEKSRAILSSKLSTGVQTLSGQEDAIPRYVTETIKLVGNIRVLNIHERREQIGKTEALKLLELKNSRDGAETWDSLQRTIQNLLGVKIQIFSQNLAAPGTYVQIKAELDVDNFLAEANGSGIKEALRVVLDTEFDKPDFLMVEEPEVHLHPGLETNLMQYLSEAASKRQIFITTHSTNFIDTATSRNVFLVKKNGSTSVHSIPVEEEFDKIIDQLGLRLSALFMFDRLVFVEGPSDEAVIREWAVRLGINFSRRNVGFVSLKGIGNFTHYAALETLSFLAKRQVKSWFIVDRDEKTDKELRQMATRVGADAKFFSTKGRELENYLTDPKPNVKFIKDRLKQEKTSEGTIEEKQFETYIAEEATNLKQVAFYKAVLSRVCRPIYPPRGIKENLDTEDAVRAGVQEQIESMKNALTDLEGILHGSIGEIQKEFEKNWNEDKLSVVPGSELLDAVYKRYGLRFEKIRDSARLAAYMEKEEIPTEIHKLLRSIGE